MIVRELITKLGFAVNDSGLKKAEAGIASFKSTALVAAAAIAGIAAGIFATVKSAAHFGDDLVKTSQRVGIGVEGLQRFRYAAALADVESAELTQGLVFLSRNFASAAAGSKETGKAFAALKINPKTIKDNEELLLKVADGFSKMEAGPKKTALSMEIFGRAGARLIPFLNAGASGIRAMGKELDDLGLIMGVDAAKAGEEFNDNLTRLEFIATGVKNVIGARLLPAFLEATEKVLAWVKANKEVIHSGIEGFLDVLAGIVDVLGAGIDLVVDGFGALSKALGSSKRAAEALAIAGIALGIAFAWIDWVPLLIGAIAAAIFLLYDDIKAFLEGRPSFFKPVYEKAVVVIDWIKEKWNSLMNVIDDIKTVVDNDVLPVIRKLEPVFKAVFDNSILGAFINNLDKIKEIIGVIVEKIENSSVAKFLGGVNEKFGVGSAIKDALVNQIPGVGAFNFLSNVGDLISQRADTIRAASGNAKSNANLLNPGAPGAAGGDKVQNNDVKVNNTINVTIPPGTDPKAVGEEINKTLTEKIGGDLRAALSAVQSSVV